jgi:hypothetical protein
MDTDIEPIRNLFIIQPIHNQLDNFLLPRRQVELLGNLTSEYLAAGSSLFM